MTRVCGDCPGASTPFCYAHIAEASGSERQRLQMDALYVTRIKPTNAAFFDWRALDDVRVEPAEPTTPNGSPISTIDTKDRPQPSSRAPGGAASRRRFTCSAEPTTPVSGFSRCWTSARPTRR